MHRLWHVSALAVVLFGGAAAVVLALVPLALHAPPAGYARLRPLLWGLAVAAAAVLVVEWAVVH